MMAARTVSVESPLMMGIFFLGFCEPEHVSGAEQGVGGF